MNISTASTLFSSASDEWGTPDDLFAVLDREVRESDKNELGFDMDAAASATNSKVGPYFGPDHDDPRFRDSLAVDWNERNDVTANVWLNPPYSKVGEFMAKCVEQAPKNGGCLIYALIPARPDTRWWWNSVLKADEIRFLKGRLKFQIPGKESSSAPFPSAVAIFRPQTGRFKRERETWFWDWRKDRDAVQEQDRAA